ncbi:MAG TPA: hypothetical protein VK835_14095 [Bacteroidia bacterium]|nr:hypothetical protein [Bacteroidia bacterium]
MRKILLSITLLVCFCFPALSQNDSVTSQSETTTVKKKKRFTFYGMWGYNREAFTKSTIHFKNNGTAGANDPVHSSYDFTIHNVKAKDSPDFDQIAGSWSDVLNLTIPQFNFRIGAYFNDEKDMGIELSYDHAKYVVTDGQGINFTGTVAGKSISNPDSFPTRQQFHFEHTDGANFWMVNFIKRWKLYVSANKKHNIGFIVKPGAGMVVPRTDVTVFSTRLNNYWHIAGVIAGVETGFRMQFFNHICVELTTKASYADYMQCLVQYAGNGTASHHFGTIAALLNVGYQFNSNVPNFHLFKKKKS